MTAPEDYDREETEQPVPDQPTTDESNEPATDPYEDDESRPGDQNDVTL